jgi:MoxR-like ATPase
MMARRLAGILPPLAFEEALDVSAVHSVAGLLPPGTGLLLDRPFRAPHHTISNAALVGGGSIPRPGEVSLAHHGVLFLDEMLEFSRHVLEVLRQPLEEGRVTIARTARTAVFPARFMLVGAMNPCPCGFAGDPRRECRCTPQQLARYRDRLSGPLRDRLDLTVDVPALALDALSDEGGGEPSAAVRARVVAARARQAARHAADGISTNAELPSGLLAKHCAATGAARRLLRSAMHRLALSARGYDRVRKVARTIADLAGDDEIGADAMAEALQPATRLYSTSASGRQRGTGHRGRHSRKICVCAMIGRRTAGTHGHYAAADLALRARRARLVHRVDDDPRGTLPRDARLVPEPEPELPPAVGAQVFLSVHLRVLLQPLRRGIFRGADRFQAAPARLARPPDRVVRAGLGRHSYELRAAAPHQARAGRDPGGQAAAAETSPAVTITET